MFIKLGLTGGIGTGKTKVSYVFSALGVPVFYADYEAKKFLNLDNVKKQLKSLFGEIIFDNSNEVVKSNLAKIVFNDPSALMKLNSLVHPMLMDRFKNWAIEKQEEGYRYVIIEAAILFEAEFNLHVDKVLCITAPMNERLERVSKRDGVDIGDIKDRIRNQWNEEELIKRSDFVINNCNDCSILNEIIKIHNSLI